MLTDSVIPARARAILEVALLLVGAMVGALICSLLLCLMKGPLSQRDCLADRSGREGDSESGVGVALRYKDDSK